MDKILPFRFPINDLKYRPTLGFSLICFIIILLGCRAGSEKMDTASTIYSIDFENALENPVLIDLAEICDEIEYIPLESGPGFFIKRIWEISLSDSFIFVSDGDKLIQFTKAGRFERIIGALGRGPGEYLSVSSFDFNNKSNEILILSPGKIIRYSTSGRFLAEFKIRFPCSQFIYAENSFVFYPYRIPFYTEKQNTGLLFYSDSGLQFKKIKSSIADREGGIVIPRSCLHKFNNELYFMEYGTDTLFKIVSFNKQAHSIINLGKYKMKSDLSSDEILALKNKAWLNQILEAENYLFFKVWWNLSDSVTNCVYSKTKSKLFALSEGSFANKELGGAIFWPEAVTDEGYLVDFIEAFKLSKVLNDSGMQLRSNNLNILNTVFKNLDENSNPVILIVKPMTN